MLLPAELNQSSCKAEALPIKVPVRQKLYQSKFLQGRSSTNQSSCKAEALPIKVPARQKLYQGMPE
jgi:hypothetical protein